MDSAILATASAYMVGRSRLDLSLRHAACTVSGHSARGRRPLFSWGDIPPLSAVILSSGGGRTAPRPRELRPGRLRVTRSRGLRGLQRWRRQIAAGLHEWRIGHGTEPAVVHRPRPRRLIAPGRPQRPVMTLSLHELFVRPDLGDP